MPYTDGMTNESVTTKKVHKKGYAAKSLGGLAMILGILVAVISGAFTPISALLFFGGLIALIVGIALRDTDQA